MRTAGRVTIVNLHGAGSMVYLPRHAAAKGFPTSHHERFRKLLSKMFFLPHGTCQPSNFRPSKRFGCFDETIDADRIILTHSVFQTPPTFLEAFVFLLPGRAHCYRPLEFFLQPRPQPGGGCNLTPGRKRGVSWGAMLSLSTGTCGKGGSACKMRVKRASDG